MTTTATVPDGSAKPENPSVQELVQRTLANRAEAPEPEEEPVAEPADGEEATPVEAAPQAPVTGAWRNVILDDVDHGFFRGKPAEELFKSYQHSETAKQKAEREAAELRVENERLRRQQETVETVQRMFPQPQAAPEPTKEDPRDAEIDRIWFENPAEARRLMREQAEEIADRKATEKFDKLYSERRTAEQAQDSQSRAQEAASTAAQLVAQHYGVDEITAAKRIAATYPFLAQQAKENPSVWFRPDSYLNQVVDLHGPPPARQESVAPAPPVVPPATAPTAKQPPGATKPAPMNPNPTPRGAPLSEAARQLRERLGQEMGVTDLVARGEKRRARG